ncbi:MAG: ROK family protein [Cyclobacteriaceae bacterium]|nr:ROK family protein [Cyclobacteriaceae bacterium]
MEKYMGIDVGGTNIKIGIVDREGGMESKMKYATANLRESGDFVKGYLDILAGEFEKHPEIKEVGMGIPGTISVDRTRCMEVVSIPALDGVELKKHLKDRFPDKEFYLENDANVAALGEYYFSGTKIPENYLFVTLGTGIGSAAIINKKIFIGGDGNGMEMGHILSRNGKELEENIGKRGIMKRAHKLIDKKKTTLKNHTILSPKIILREALDGDKVSIKIFREVGELLGEGLVAAVRLLDIKTILIGGGLSAGFDIMIEKLNDTLEYNLTPYYADELVIKRAELGNDAGIIGAASLCFK